MIGKRCILNFDIHFKRSISIYDNVSINESIEAAKRTSRMSNYSNKTATSEKSPHNSSFKDSDTHHHADNENTVAQSLSFIENEIKHLSADLDKKLNCSSPIQNSLIEQVVINNGENSFSKVVEKCEVTVTPSNSNINQTVVFKTGDKRNIPYSTIQNNHTNVNDNTVHVENVKIIENETIISGNKMLNSVCTTSYSKSFSRNENNSRPTFISINSLSNNAKSNNRTSDRHGIVDITTSTVNNDFNETINQNSPSKIRIFVPYQNESNDSSDNPVQNELPAVET